MNTKFKKELEVLKVVKVRLYPNKKEQQLIHKTFDSCRFVYNQLIVKAS